MATDDEKTSPAWIKGTMTVSASAERQEKIRHFLTSNSLEFPNISAMFFFLLEKFASIQEAFHEQLNKLQGEIITCAKMNEALEKKVEYLEKFQELEAKAVEDLHKTQIELNNVMLANDSLQRALSSGDAAPAAEFALPEALVKSEHWQLLSEFITAEAQKGANDASLSLSDKDIIEIMVNAYGEDIKKLNSGKS